MCVCLYVCVCVCVCVGVYYIHTYIHSVLYVYTNVLTSLNVAHYCADGVPLKYYLACFEVLASHLKISHSASVFVIFY